MSEKRTIARPYARAMFTAIQAEDASKVNMMSQLLAIASAAVQTEALDQAIKNPNVADEQIVTILLQICEDADANVVATFGNKALTAWLTLLADAGRLDCLPEITTLYNEASAAHQAAVDVVITSAEPLSEAQQQQLVKQLSQKWNKTVHPVYQTDAALLGGVRIQAGDWVLDRSIAEKLLRLSEDIQS